MNEQPDSLNSEAERLRNAIPSLRECQTVEPIDKGYSRDRKYTVYGKDGAAQYVLRTYAIGEHEVKKREFEALKRMEEKGVTCSRPIEIGRLAELEIGYMLVSHIPGIEATEALPLLSEDEQCRIGLQAGEELRKIHQVLAPDSIGSWQARMVEKHAKYRIDYERLGVRIEGEGELFAFIDSHLHLMQGRPNVFQHDDFHIGNLIVQDGKLSGVIDFNRYDWGDPISDLLKIGIFSAEVSVPFSVGQLIGYHEGDEPDDDFWRLYSLYLAMTLVSSVVWILKTKPEELDVMMAKIVKVMNDHRNFDTVVPAWYRSFFKKSLEI
ncbi:phosphotransferase family protein [Paenibacillus sp. NPDC058071]|uniref:phosphotransferase family protein n=1 Tax=Paenibacillus sp. NPDC058071 TaxID=3346326 RepID=UPI0036DDA782